jgi:hypothetical protein
MSLYPFICKYHKFFIGHPIIHVGDACKDIEAMLEKESLIKCSILPPKRLYHPVLPFRCNNRLLFCLCRTCAIEQNTSECAHETIAERSLVGQWVIDEVKMTVEKGYRVIEVIEIYEYNVTQYDPTSGERGLFVQYINTFLKLKAEASGYPGWVTRHEDEDRYVRSFSLKEVIELYKEAMRRNAA